MEKLILGVVRFLISIQWILSALIYIWTLYIAYSISGILAAGVTFFLPFLGQAYWGFKAWQTSGFDSPYIQWILVLIALWVIQKLIYVSVVVYENKKNEIIP